MATESTAAGPHRTKGLAKRGRAGTRVGEVARCAKLAAKGLKDTADVAEFFTALIDDTLQGRVPVDTASVICNAAGKALKAVEMQVQYGEGNALHIRRALRHHSFPCAP